MWRRCILIVLLMLPLVAAGAVDVLIIQHGYDGTIEQAGVLVRWQYTGGRMLVEWSDTTTDGIFRNDFED